MTDIGLWTIAAQHPDRPAVIEPDGTVVSYAELAARADRPAGACRRSASRPGDCVAVMLSNSSAVLALFFAAMETGLYVVPVNWHLAAAEVAYILRDSGAGAFVADERFAAAATAAADQAGIGQDARFAVGAVPGFAPLAEPGRRRRGPPGAAHPGRSDGVHVGHLGPPQGRAARAHRR